jgi:glycolate oxidase FAD binding subunit
LGVLLTASLKVLPKPQAELTLQFECSEEEAIRRMNEWAGRPLPMSATAWLSGVLSVRLSGAGSSVVAAHKKLGGELHDHGEDFWVGLRDHNATFFRSDTPLWRLSLPPTTPALALSGKLLIAWGGAERWLKSDAASSEIRALAAARGGHATQFSGDKACGVFHPLPEALMKYHRRLKQQFDPRGILNPGRMYP